MHCHLGHNRKKKETNEKEPNEMPKTFMPSKRVQKPLEGKHCRKGRNQGKRTKWNT
jgi:hypothetical protein